MLCCLDRAGRPGARRAWCVRAAAAIVLSAGALASPATARAQTNQGFSVNRFDPSERGSDWFANESLDLRGTRLAFGVVGDYGHKPLVVYNSDGSERTVLIRHQLFTHVGATLVLADRLRAAVSLPIALYQDGDTGTLRGETFSSSNATTIGDLRLGADVRLLGDYDGPAELAVGLQAHLPTGDRAAFTGDGGSNVRLVPRAMLAGDIDGFVYAARVGYEYRSIGSDFAGSTVGSEFTFGVAAGLRVADRRLTLGPELYGATVVESQAFRTRNTPVELLFGGHYAFPGGFRVGLGGGPGLTRGYGEPDVRLLASVEWFQEYKKAEPPPPPHPPLPPPADRDLDGILDSADACPDTAGVPSSDPKLNGCPPPDRDKDGIFDKDDACPDDPGPTSDDPAKNGCPDRDKDGILDKVDACADDPGPADADPKKNGCPDRDKDGVVDKDDACPDQPGAPDPDPKKNGCPAARIEGKEIKIIEQVKFAFGSAKILPESDTVLQAVLDILKAHTEITKVSVEGHTDNKGARALNTKLSKDRAAAVVKWLVDHGVATGRLTSQGFGPDRPLDTNDTDQGRQNNRRVEFHIQSGTPSVEIRQATPPDASAASPPSPAPATTPPATPKPTP